MRTRAKFRCNWVRDHGDNKLIQLGVVYSKVQGTEDHDFTKATPSGHIEMQDVGLQTRKSQSDLI